MKLLNFILVGGILASRQLLAIPAFETDEAAHEWLRSASPAYAEMVKEVETRGPILFAATEDYDNGVAWWWEGKNHLQMNPRLTGAKRLSILIFELTNLYQDPRHQALAARVRRDDLTNGTEFAILRELVEYYGLGLHRAVLAELAAAGHEIPVEMISWVTPAGSFEAYRIPRVYDFIEAQRASGHRGHYLKLFERHRLETPLSP